MDFIQAASLIEQLDKKLMVMLRDGKILIGYLRSVDQFSNLVLHRTVERIYVGKKFGDIPRGVFLIRGENVAVLGEIDPLKESQQPAQEVSVTEILQAQQQEQDEKQAKSRLIVEALKQRGLAYMITDNPLAQET